MVLSSHCSSFSYCSSNFAMYCSPYSYYTSNYCKMIMVLSNHVFFEFCNSNIRHSLLLLIQLSHFKLLQNDYGSIQSFIFLILQQQQWTFLYCSPFSYCSWNFAMHLLSLQLSHFQLLQNNYGAIQSCIYLFCNSNSGHFSIAPYLVIALPTLQCIALHIVITLPTIVIVVGVLGS